jgi:diaminopimelate decarboxylase
VLPDGAETPAYVYDLAELRRSWSLLRDAVPAQAGILYSLKANAHPDILAVLRSLGTDAEVCSPGELDAALAAGFAPGRMLYTGPGKRAADLERALRAGVRRFSVDSAHAMDQLDALAARAGTVARALLRINDDRPAAGQRLVMTGVAAQFGADADQVVAEPHRYESRPHLRLDGLHLYMGSNIDDEDALIAQFAQAAATASRLAAALDVRWRMVNLGGGFGAPFARTGDLPKFPDLSVRLGAVLDETMPGWRHAAPSVVVESGRHLAATCGTLYTRVLDVKRSHGERMVVLESGVNHLGGMSGLRRLPQISPDLRAEATGPLAPATVCGPLCTPLDVWARRAMLPDVAPGDLIQVANVGAYGLSASLVAFLGHPLPVEIVVDGDRVHSSGRLVLERRSVPIRQRKESDPWTPSSSACSGRS